MKSCIGFLLAATALFYAPVSSFSDPQVDPKDLPRLKPTEPAVALKTFRVKPGFRLELVAAEPLVMDPIAMSFDENGRLFVVEMRGYSERRDDRMGRIRLLEDTDGDGRFDKSTVYADDLPWPTAVICYNGGVFVGATPDVFWFKDHDGDGVADERKVVFTGFGAGRDRLNVQALFNSFAWGLDNRIHGATAGNGGTVIRSGDPNAQALELRGRDFSIDPRLMTMRPESGTAQYGLSFDSRGRKFVCSNSHHIQALMYELRYGGSNPHYAMPGALVDIAADGPAAEVFRLSPDEPWRIIRTAWRVSGVVPGMIEGGGRISGYFTAATGVTIYRGDVFPAGFADNAFIADAGSNLIHRKRIRENGVELIAERPEDERDTEFLASTDNWFRPVQMANGPDGALYIADMYREVIEHPWSIPESIKQHLDLNSGNDRGRIYRVVPEGFRQPKPPRLGRLSVIELAALLAHPNGWHRETASRLLYERQDKAAVPELEKLLRQSPEALGRMHSLHALKGLGALAETHLLEALEDTDERVREHGIRLAEEFPMQPQDSALVSKLLALAADPSPRVRYQLAFTLGHLPPPGRITGLASIARKDAASPWVRAAILSSLNEGASKVFMLLFKNAEFSRSAAGREMLRQLSQVIGAKNQPAEVASVLALATEDREFDVAQPVIQGLGEGLARARSSLAKADTEGRLQPLFSRAIAVAQDRQATETNRLQAVRLLGLHQYRAVAKTLYGLLSPQESQQIQSEALAALARFTEPDLAGELVGRWASLSPRLRTEALNVLLARPERLSVLLGAMEKGAVRASEFSTTQQQFLKNHRDAAIRKRAGALLESGATAPRQEVVDKFLPALRLKGDAARGKTIFQTLCTSCHRSGGEGHALGPDMATVKSAGVEKLLVNILDPNREVAPAFVSYLVETRDGESVLGLVASETGNSVVLRQAFGIEHTLLRSNIQRMQSQGQSLMPEGLEAGLTSQGMADLLEYIMTAE